ncbi:MAG: hypothetical protein ACK4IX_06500 [Candidatus Sericytochromatia bacterium]
MKVKLVEDPQYFLDLDTNQLTERLIFSNENEEPFFKIGSNKLGFKDFEIEISKKDIKSTEITGINIFLPNVENAKILEISKFFNMTEEQFNEVKNLEKATLAFSIESEIIEKYIQPFYDSNEKSKNIFQFVDEKNNIVLFDFQNYIIAGLQEEN